ncbi:FtsB family cell division protein [Anaeroselena agilis]|uniref:Septum formation initiator family protein n=1 Tax=Anaeroselena agilis TaxID=3063788 RepID=A0ABU3P172_9FIRM|nr:septum formation initiator family protein [Selenomonadales bacterium 4137-cl]
MAEQKRTVKYRIRWFRVTVLAVVGYCLYVLAGQQMEMNALNRETEATRIRMEQLRQANETLADEKKKLTTPAYVEKLAREELGLVKPGEVPYVPAEKN